MRVSSVHKFGCEEFQKDFVWAVMSAFLVQHSIFGFQKARCLHVHRKAREMLDGVQDMLFVSGLVSERWSETQLRFWIGMGRS